MKDWMPVPQCAAESSCIFPGIDAGPCALHRVHEEFDESLYCLTLFMGPRGRYLLESKKDKYGQDFDAKEGYYIVGVKRPWKSNRRSGRTIIQQYLDSRARLRKREREGFVGRNDSLEWIDRLSRYEGIINTVTQLPIGVWSEFSAEGDVKQFANRVRCILSSNKQTMHFKWKVKPLDMSIGICKSGNWQSAIEILRTFGANL